MTIIEPRRKAARVIDGLVEFKGLGGSQPAQRADDGSFACLIFSNEASEVANFELAAVFDRTIVLDSSSDQLHVFPIVRIIN